MLPLQPMRLLRVPQPFDHPEFIYEIKTDGFRGLAAVEPGRCELISRNGHTFKQWPSLQREIARSLRCRSAVLDGEIACLNADGSANYYCLLFRRGSPFYMAVGGRDPFSTQRAHSWLTLVLLLPALVSC